MPLDGLMECIVDHIQDKLEGHELKLDNWKITGRRGHHKMQFRLRLVSKINGKRYVMSTSDNEVAFEDGTLTLELPKHAMTMSC